MRRLIAIAAFMMLWVGGHQAEAAVKIIIQKKAGLPVTTFNVTFRVGSADDPRGLEGLTNLTWLLVREGGMRAWQGQPARTRAELEELLYPLDADIGPSVENEQVSFSVTAPAAEAERVFDLLAQLVLAPAFDAQEFARLKAEQLDWLTNQLPREDQEELGKAALDWALYGQGHPYAHPVKGTVEGVKASTLEKIREFHAANFTQKRLTVGVAGVVSASLRDKINRVFSGLPAGASSRAEIAAAKPADKPRLLLVKGPFESTGVHLGLPLPVNRASPEFAELYLASVAFGKHRSFVGRLMNAVREVRSLNYGTYAYVENFPHGGALLSPPTQAARSRQAFTVWARPTTLENGCFLLRQVVREVTSLAERGLSAAEFKQGQSHVVGNAPLLATSIEDRLGYEIDALFYGLKGDTFEMLQKGAAKTTREKVNALLKKYLDPSRLVMVVVTPNPDEFRKQLARERCEIHYAAGVSKPPEVLAEDAQIATFPIELGPDQIKVIDSEQLFVK